MAENREREDDDETPDDARMQGERGYGGVGYPRSLGDETDEMGAAS